MTPHEDFSKVVDTVHRQTTAIWFVYPKVLAIVSGEWAGTLEAAGWRPAYDSGEGSVVHEADLNDPNFAQLWQALCRAEGRIPRDAVQIAEDEE